MFRLRALPIVPRTPRIITRCCHSATPVPPKVISAVFIGCCVSSLVGTCAATAYVFSNRDWKSYSRTNNIGTCLGGIALIPVLSILVGCVTFVGAFVAVIATVLYSSVNAFGVMMSLMVNVDNITKRVDADGDNDDDNDDNINT